MNVLFDSMCVKHSHLLNEDNKYGKLFFHTNEDFDRLFENIDFKEKNVLSVLSSADQMFMAYNLGANRVDVFDKNRLTLYYYYFRNWAIKYYGNVYPYMILYNDYKKMERLLNIVQVKSRQEKKALLFWKRLCKDKYLFSSLFIEDIDSMPFEDCEELKKIIDKDIKFYNVDFFKKVRIKNKYDIIIFSNILEWSGESERKLTVARDNLNNLVNDNGLVICSELKYRMCQYKRDERRIFEENFSFREIGTRVGYIYEKK